MRKHLYIFPLIATTLLITSCGTENKNDSVSTSPAIIVKVNKVQNNKNASFLSVSGKIQAEKSADLSTRMMGYVDKVHVNVGDKVIKGQLLVSLKNTDLQAKKAQVNANITQAKAAFINAEKNYNRFQNLYKSNSITQKEMDDMTASYQMAKAGLEAANQLKNEINAQFAYSNIIAPFGGIITRKNIENGDMASPGMPLISIENPSVFEVIAMVPETEISEIKNETKVRVLVKSINSLITGKVTEISASSKNTGGQYLVKIKLEKSTGSILSGMFATVQFPSKRKTNNMVLISKDALISNGQLHGVYTVSQSNKALLRWLRLGRTYGNQVEVLSGLSINESYIISSKGKLYNGAKVTIQ